nr:immunoglobulin heavy chain junction region [Mus musculus]
TVQGTTVVATGLLT